MERCVKVVAADDRLRQLFETVSLGEIELTTNGQTMELGRGVTLIVGPNNSGKTTLLSELETFLWAKTTALRKVVKTARINPGCPIEELLDAFDRCAASEDSDLVLRDSADPYVLTPSGLRATRTSFESIWATQALPAHTAEMFALHLSVESRLDSSTDDAPEVLAPAPGKPLHQLWQLTELEARVNAVIEATFDEDIFVNRFGKKISIHLGAASPKRSRCTKQVISRGASENEHARRSGSRNASVLQCRPSRNRSVGSDNSDR